ncbi:MAG TPA: DUF1501 domain-containing protein [Pyrinomonadaceae bacterium]|nr:DUF1501 domain-containing protein [Pyrinomonadaceae bacterium]
MNESRRDFLKRSGCALGMTAIATQMQHLGAMSTLAQRSIDRRRSIESAAGDPGYKALVLVFLAGGNDGNNMVIPNHSDASVSGYAAYSAARNAQGLAIPQASLLPIAVPAIGGLSYGLHPSLGPVSGQPNNGIHELWGLGKMAIVPNVGTLVRPLTKAQYQSSSFQKPSQLFSHSDQIAQSQTAVSNTEAFTGWGGRLSDRMTPLQPPAPNDPLVPMITSISGSQLFTSGQTTLPMAIADSNTSLANVLNPSGFGNTGGAARKVSFDQLRGYDLDSNYIRAASDVTNLALQANGALQSTSEVTVTFPNTSIGRQLKQAARIIKERTDLRVQRQIFFCQVGGFDTHSNQLNTQANLLTQFSQAVRAFYDEMGVQGVSESVTLFTMSDFARTLNPAGSGATVGTDHAWGNHMFVIGGSVMGGNFYGLPGANGTPFPTLTIGAAGPDDTESSSSARGRWIPTTSVEQYAATLAKWYGLPQDTLTLQSVFPNLGNFNMATGSLNFLP